MLLFDNTLIYIEIILGINISVGEKRNNTVVV